MDSQNDGVHFPHLVKGAIVGALIGCLIGGLVGMTGGGVANGAIWGLFLWCNCRNCNWVYTARDQV